MTIFLEAPFLPDSIQMRVDHITVQMVLLLEDPLRFATMHLLYKSYIPEDSA